VLADSLVKVRNTEEWTKLLRTSRNRHILHMPMEWMRFFGLCLSGVMNGRQNVKKTGSFSVLW